MLLKNFCNLTCKKALVLVFGAVVFLIFTCYMLMFNHGQPEDIIAANKGTKSHGRHFAEKNLKNLDELEREIAEEERKAIEYWETFIKEHDFVAIGEIYDNCGELMTQTSISVPLHVPK